MVECALFNQASNGDLRYRLGTLTSRNLPLAIFLESDVAFSGYRINAWTGSRTTHADDSDILRQLGIGFIQYAPPDAPPTEGEAAFSYPTNTWVVTPFRLNNVRWNAGSWEGGSDITFRNAATARININGTNYRIRNVYIPSGGEQVVWVKWRTPSTPRTLTITASSNRGLYYNQRSYGNTSMRYVNSITATVQIYDSNNENEPPDPTINDTAGGYYANRASSIKSSLLSSSTATNSWYVWDCWYDSEDEAIHYGRINYTAEIRNTTVQISPDRRNPTAFTRNYQTYMKSGYGIEIAVQSNIRITVQNQRLGTTSTTNYGDPSSTNFAAAPQHFFAFFPEFHYATYFRQLELSNNRQVFRRNRFSTYNDPNHYTPWWFPDNAGYSVLAKSDFAYTPAGQMQLYSESNSIVIQGNLIQDWHVRPIR
jgi:hypothetical protein